MKKFKKCYKYWLHSLWIRIRYFITQSVNPNLGMNVIDPIIRDYSALSYSNLRHVVLNRWVKDPVIYTCFLHEVGHIVSPNQSRDVKRTKAEIWGNEVDAWEWAMEHAIEWTHEMELVKRRCLRTYKEYQPTFEGAKL